MSIDSLIPDPKDLIELEPEELAGILMEILNSLPPSEERQLNRRNFILDGKRRYSRDLEDEVSQALMEAWVRLEREGLLVPRPGSTGEWVNFSRRARKLTTRKQLNHNRVSNQLPRHQLHPRIAEKVWFGRPEIFQTGTTDAYSCGKRSGKMIP